MQAKSLPPIILFLNNLKIISIVVNFALQNLLLTQKRKHRIQNPIQTQEYGEVLNPTPYQLTQN
jgi:hypothetical protein